MKCPVCEGELREYQAPGFRVDICRDGCSGQWFDARELEKCNQHTEVFPEELLLLRKSPNVVIDRSLIRQCPRCVGVDLQRVVLDADKRFEIDSCPSCSGSWLDIGELSYLRQQDKEAHAIEERMRQYEQKIEAQIQAVDRAFGVKALVKKLLAS